ncbi:glyoxalase [Mesobacillus maritimus]|uniref:VOC family protein n=1 Tax=Mesobacillus maritimus TaxID=1643336 RepID=UPI00203AC2EF|nr:VOC family protein [Mesobacillus maritimus]MCM3585984.1 glyoxalase [Mesobacillus maritimus]
MSFRFNDIDHIQLAAPKGKEKEAREFFCGILRMEEIEKPVALKTNGGAWFKSGNVQIHVGIEEPFSPSKKAHPAFKIENLEGLKQHLTKHKILFIEDHLLPGANRIHIHDPFGNRIELLEWKPSR